MTYQIQNDLKGNHCAVCKTNADGSGMSIPFDLQNIDYQAYLQFLADGGVPLPADEVK
ncbi:MAG: hypothetical protein WCO04_18805 [Pseudomonadota bacterium]